MRDARARRTYMVVDRWRLGGGQAGGWRWRGGGGGGGGRFCVCMHIDSTTDDSTYIGGPPSPSPRTGAPPSPWPRVKHAHTPTHRPALAFPLLVSLAIPFYRVALYSRSRHKDVPTTTHRASQSSALARRPSRCQYLESQNVRGSGAHQYARGPQVPVPNSVPGGRSTPDTQVTLSSLTRNGALAISCRWRFRHRASIPGDLWFTSGWAGSSWNFNQQSPNEWECASGSKQRAAPHHVQVLHGSFEKGPPLTEGRCARHACSHSSHVCLVCPMPHRIPSPS